MPIAMAPCLLAATAINSGHALIVAMIATVVGILSTLGWRAGRAMMKDPGGYRRALLAKGSGHPLAMLWTRRDGERDLRRWGVWFSRLALYYAVFSFGLAGTLLTLAVMERAGMTHAVKPIAEFLSKLEAGLSKGARG